MTKRRIRIPNNWRPRSYQMPLWSYLENGGTRAVECAHRRWGKDDVGLHWSATAQTHVPGNYWHMLPEAAQARKAIWDAINPHTGKKRRDEAFPEGIRTGKSEQEMKIETIFNTTWQVVGSDNYNSLVGSPPVGIVFSEWAIAKPDAWAYLRPILAENGGWALFIYTPRGRNHGKTIYDLAVEEASWFADISTVDDTTVFSPEQLEAERRELVKQYGPSRGEALFRQEYYCFPPGTMIFTSTGQKVIENISAGDIVLSHSGRWRKVKSTTKRQYSGDMVELESNGVHSSIICTPDHPIRTCDPNTQTYAWKKAKTVEFDDYLVLPRIKQYKNKTISSALAEIIAWYISEGSVFKNGTQFTFNKKEDEYKNRVMLLCSEYGKSSIIAGDTADNVVVYSSWLTDFLVSNCGSGAKNKRIPWSLISGHEELVYEILLFGDGCRGEYSGIRDVYSTVSETLAYDFQLLSHTIGLSASIVKRPKEKQTSTICGRDVSVLDSYNVRVSTRATAKNKNRRKIRPQKHGVAVAVRSKKTLQYDGYVYNFSVEYDESYTANGRSVHNCSFDEAFTGKVVYPEFSQTEHVSKLPLLSIVCDEIDNSANKIVVRGWDNTGLHPGCVLFYVLPMGRIRIFMEFWKDDIGIEDYAEWVIEWCAANLPRGTKYRDIGDPAQKTRDSRKMTPQIYIKNKTGIYIEDGIQTFKIRRESVAQKLNRRIMGESALQVDPTQCPLLLSGFMGGYGYKEIGTTGLFHTEPVKNEYADVHDALQYPFTILFPSIEEDNHVLDTSVLSSVRDRVVGI